MFADAAFQHHWNTFPSSVFYIEVEPETEGARPNIGSGFHLGGGYIATARHVIENKKIRSIGRHNMSLKTSLDHTGRPHLTSRYTDFNYTGAVKVFDHPVCTIDVSIVQMTERISDCYPRVEEFEPRAQMADNADILSLGELIFTSVAVAGYPQIPLSAEASLVMIRGEISAVITNVLNKKRCFVLSGMARGGFSGGPVFLLGNPTVQNSATLIKPNAGRVIGIICDSLSIATSSKEPRPEELGFLAASSIDRIKETIEHHGIKIPSDSTGIYD